MKYLSIITLLTCSFLVNANTPLPENRHISIIGKAQLKAKPDIVVVSLAVESSKTKSSQAKKDVDDRVNNFIDGLSQFDIDEENVSASSISTRPRYHRDKNGKEILSGYSANRNLTVTFKDIKKLSAFMDFALKVNINKISNVEFKSSKEESLKSEVLALAVKDAKQKGESLATAFGAKLGHIYSINSSSNQFRNAYGANGDIERMTVSGVRYNKQSKPGKYLKKNIVFSSSVSAVFDLEVD
ncbi:MAG: SIMPL domain-containing protein [Colwellia sp.]|jgi:hypothetical protein|nr:MAG: SIMPL domain-containing protein [Colwellia sp.]